MSRTLAVLLITISLLVGNIALASPKSNYLLFCSGCHRADGAGKPPNVPTLVGELGRMLTVPEMRSYILRIPGASQAPLSNAKLAEVINWVLREFNTDTLPVGFTPITEVEAEVSRGNVLLDPLKYRLQHWGDYP